MLRKTLHRHTSLYARTRGGVAQVARRASGRNEFRCLGRGPLPALTSCSQRSVVRCALVFILFFNTQQFTYTRNNVRWYILALSSLPWFLDLCPPCPSLLHLRRRGCSLGGTRRSKSPTSCAPTRTRKTRRGIRGHGITNYTYAKSNGPLGSNLGPAQSPTPPLHATKASDSANGDPGPQTQTPPSLPNSTTSTCAAPWASQTNGTSARTLRILWWNVQSLTAVWHMTDF